jgi:hypothetical protein
VVGDVIGMRAGLAAGLLLCLLALSSCGGSSESTTAQSDGGNTGTQYEQAPVVVAAKANRNCEGMLRAVSRVGREAQEAGYETAKELTTKGFAEPGMRLMKDLARRQQALQADAASSAFDAYATSFDPIIVLGEQWLQAQRDLDFERVDQLQELLTDRGTEQQALAKRAGLARCNVDFLNAMVRGTSP